MFISQIFCHVWNDLTYLQKSAWDNYKDITFLFGKTTIINQRKSKRWAPIKPVDPKFHSG